MSKFDKEKRIKSFGKGRKNSSFKQHIYDTVEEDQEIQEEINRELSQKDKSEQ